MHSKRQAFRKPCGKVGGVGQFPKIVLYGWGGSDFRN